MSYILDDTIASIAVAAQEILGVSDTPVVEPANPKFGADLAIPTFAFARSMGKSPQDIAAQLAQGLQHAAIARVEAAGGFVNIWLDPSYLVQGLYRDIAQHDKYGTSDDGRGKTVIVEFPSPNMAKPFSIGHLRPAVQGWALTQLMKATGYTVITDNHLGDWGAPFGKWVVGFRHYSSDEQLENDGIYELARVYVQITADLKAEKESGSDKLAQEVQGWLLRLERGEPEAVAYRERFLKISLDHIHHVMERLGIKTDYEYGEAFYIPEGKRMVDQLVADGIAQRQADGSVIVLLDDYGIEVPILLEKSNGAALYATSDLATLKFRYDKWRPDKVIYVVGSEQQFHFNQIFALADKLGYRSEYVHYWFGMIDQINEDGTRSKMSSRKGVVLLEELLDRAEQGARTHAVDPAALTQKSVEQIALGAVKFTDFAQDKKTSMLFDWDRIFNVQGFSGPYIQYAAVRVRSILRKFGKGQQTDIAGYDWEAEQNILLHLARYPWVIREAAQYYEPHRVALYLYELARLLNQYYENTQVGNAEVEKVRDLRLGLLDVVGNIFEHGLGILGIEVPEKM